MADNQPDFKQLVKLLRTGERKILIITHRNPDGDAIGSSLGLIHLLHKLGHKADIMVPNRFPAFLSWMNGAGKIIIFNQQTDKAVRLLTEAEIIFALDFNDLSRVREFEEHISGGTSFKVLIDHHPDPGSFADLTYSDTSASSTAELIYNFIQHAGFGDLLDKQAATCIYAGIVTDTGCFSFNSSRPGTFRVVAHLLESGIDKDAIYDKLYDNFSVDRMRLMGYCLDQKMKLLPEYKTAYISLSQEEMKRYKFKIGDSEGFVNLPLSIRDIKFSVLFTEHKDVVKLSLRSKGNFAVNTIANEFFSGGGHKNAAGGESLETLEKTIEKFISLLPAYKNELQENEA